MGPPSTLTAFSTPFLGAGVTEAAEAPPEVIMDPLLGITVLPRIRLLRRVGEMTQDRITFPAVGVKILIEVTTYSTFLL